PQAELAQALLDLADAEHRGGHHGEAVVAGERASRLAEAVGRTDLMAAAALVAPWVSFPAATEALTRLCRVALVQETDLDLATRSRLRSKLVVLTVERSWPEAGETAATAMDLAVRSADPEALLDAAGAAITVLPECDVAGRRLGLADLAIAEATRLDRRMGLAIALTWRLRAAVELGRADLVEECLERLTAVAEASGAPLAHWHAIRARASVAVLRGDFTLVPDLNARATTIAGRSGDVVAMGMSYASARHVDEVRWVAGPGLEETLVVMAAAPPSPLMDTGRGLELLRAGRREEAEAAYRRVVPLVGTSPSTRPWMPAVQQLITLAEAFDDHALAPALVTELVPGAQLEGGVGISTAYFTGSVSRDLGRALALAGRAEEAVVELRRSIARNTRLGALPDVALGRLDLARVLARHSTGPVAREQAGVALDLATTAAEELRRLDMTGHLPGAAALVAELRGILAAVDPLSSREREVVDLVVAGRTNREIADRLVLSERTVESHVRSALMKRGCRNRAELIRAESAETGPLA
ncbi:MAG: LuxR C-terminal-related transcriptional regulator, partial [Lapillicoccus sp.]